MKRLLTTFIIMLILCSLRVPGIYAGNLVKVVLTMQAAAKISKVMTTIEKVNKIEAAPVKLQEMKQDTVNFKAPCIINNNAALIKAVPVIIKPEKHTIRTDDISGLDLND